MEISGFKFYRIAALAALLFVLTAAGCGGEGTSAPNSPDTSAPAAESKRGQEIIAEFLKRDAAPFRKARVRFIVKTDGEPDKVYEIDTWRKQMPDATTTLSQIVKPADESDLASLTIEPAGQKATVVTYAASRNEFRETDTNKIFFGGLTAGELLGEWGKFTYRYLGEKEVNGRKLLEVEGKLKDGMSSVVARMNVLFRSDYFLPTELHLFDNTGKEIRTYKTVEFKDDTTHPYALKTEVDNPVYKSHVVIEILSQEFPKAIDDMVFTRERLKQPVK